MRGREGDREEKGEREHVWRKRGEGGRDGEREAERRM